jgi:hypothetical protein
MNGLCFGVDGKPAIGSVQQHLERVEAGDFGCDGTTVTTPRPDLDAA